MAASSHVAKPLHLYTIAAGTPFLQTFAKRLLSGDIVPSITQDCDPLVLSAATIYVPSRRAARALEEVLASLMDGKVMLLPRILPLGDPAEIEERLPVFDGPSPTEPLPDAVSDLERRLYLMRLIDAWRVTLSPQMLQLEEGESFLVAKSRADAFALSGNLSALIDEMIIERADWAKMDELVDLEHDRSWELTAKFLSIAGTAWPEHLEEKKRMDAIDRRQKLIESETERLVQNDPQETIIVAGSTGTQRATAELMRAVAGLRNGAVVLPGLDQSVLDAAAWDAITLEGAGLANGLTHAQAGLKRFLLRAGAARSDAIELGQNTHPRMALLADAMRPASTTDDWIENPLQTTPHEQALQNLILIEAKDEREEAFAIALAMRERLQNPAHTIALVTPDRNLAAHVIAELKRWGIDAQDSAGLPLAQSETGRFAVLALDMVLADCAAPALLAFLRDPLCCFGLEPDPLREAVDAIETILLRGRKSNGLSSLIATAETIALGRHAPAAARRMVASLTLHGLLLLQAINDATSPLPEVQPLARWAAWHQALIERAIASPVAADIAPSGLQAWLNILDAMLEMGEDYAIDLAAYGDICRALIEGETVQDTAPINSQVKILGPLEARLLPADCMILGGLNEGVWPPATQQDAFLNRRMRIELGLTPAERRIGQSAHDFLMFAGAPELILTRAARSGEKPSLCSRFLERLKARIGHDAYAALGERGETLLHIAQQIDQSDKPGIAIEKPNPRPPLHRRSTRIAITDAETLYRDPYSIFAKRILRLHVLPLVDTPPDAALRGTIIHEALAALISEFPREWPDDGAERIFEAGEAFIANEVADPVLQLFWREQLRAIADFMHSEEKRRRAGGLLAASEVDGSIEIDLAGTKVQLVGRADRIDTMADGSLVILDYKTGSAPTKKEILAGFAPQLIVTAVMASEGAFKGISRHATLQSMAYIKLGLTSKLQELPEKGDALQRLVEQQWGHLKSYIAGFYREEQGYESRRRPKLTTHGSDYDHLARVKEWSIAIDAEPVGEEE
jgi:ATP-dependent helicase/nuclease subunit B